jgi:hypothetical protein
MLGFFLIVTMVLPTGELMDIDFGPFDQISHCQLALSRPPPIKYVPDGRIINIQCEARI